MTDSKPSSHVPIPILRTPTIDPGEEVTVDLFVSGAGDVDWCYLTVLHAHPEIVQQRDSGDLIRGVHIRNGEVLRGTEDLAEVGLEKIGLNQTGCRIGIDTELLKKGSRDELGLLEQTHPQDDGDPPFRLKLKTSDDAPPGGDYEISFILVYETAEAIVTARAPVEVHVRTIREQHSKELVAATIAGAMIALISLVYSTGFFGAISELISWYVDFYLDVVGASSLLPLSSS